MGRTEQARTPALEALFAKLTPDQQAEVTRYSELSKSEDNNDLRREMVFSMSVEALRYLNIEADTKKTTPLLKGKEGRTALRSLEVVAAVGILGLAFYLGSGWEASKRENTNANLRGSQTAVPSLTLRPSETATRTPTPTPTQTETPTLVPSPTQKPTETLTPTPEGFQPQRRLADVNTVRAEGDEDAKLRRFIEYLTQADPKKDLTKASITNPIVTKPGIYSPDPLKNGAMEQVDAEDIKNWRSTSEVLNGADKITVGSLIRKNSHDVKGAGFYGPDMNANLTLGALVELAIEHPELQGMTVKQVLEDSTWQKAIRTRRNQDQPKFFTYIGDSSLKSIQATEDKLPPELRLNWDELKTCETGVKTNTSAKNDKLTDRSRNSTIFLSPVNHNDAGQETITQADVTREEYIVVVSGKEINGVVVTGNLVITDRAIKSDEEIVGIVNSAAGNELWNCGGAGSAVITITNENGTPVKVTVTPIPSKTPEIKITPTPGGPTLTPSPDTTPTLPVPTVTAVPTNNPVIAPTIVNTPENNPTAQPSVVPTDNPPVVAPTVAPPVQQPTALFK